MFDFRPEKKLQILFLITDPPSIQLLFYHVRYRHLFLKMFVRFYIYDNHEIYHL
jgi:hypothetical protein